MPIRFDTNDDSILLLIASGAYTGTPDAHLVYINYIYGLLLKILYSSFEGIEWYTVCLAAIHVLCLSIITWRISRLHVRSIWKILGIAILYMLEAQIVLHFQYTTTAALCGTAALVLFLTGNNLQRYAAALLFTLGTLIRFDPAYLAALIFTPTIIYFLLKQKDKIKVLIPLSLFIVLSVSAYLIDKNIYDSDPEWKEYREFNYYRGRISDSPNSLKFEVFPSSLGKNDFNLLRSFFPDTRVITNEKAKEAYERIKNVSFEEKLKNIYSKENGPNLQRYKGVLLAFLLFAIFLFVVHPDKQKKYLILSSTLLMLLSLAYVTLDAFLWHRVLLSAIIPFCLVIVYISSSLEKKRIIQLTSLLIIGVIVFLAGDIRNKQKRRLREQKEGVPAIESILSDAKILKKEGEHMVSFVSVLRLEILSPYSLSEVYKDNKFVILSWLSKSPFNKGVVDSYMDLIDKNILYTEKAWLDEHLPRLQGSVKENYGIEVQVDILAVKGSDYLLRLKSVD